MWAASGALTDTHGRPCGGLATPCPALPWGISQHGDHQEPGRCAQARVSWWAWGGGSPQQEGGVGPYGWMGGPGTFSQPWSSPKFQGPRKPCPTSSRWERPLRRAPFPSWPRRAGRTDDPKGRKSTGGRRGGQGHSVSSWWARDSGRLRAPLAWQGCVRQEVGPDSAATAPTGCDTLGTASHVSRHRSSPSHPQRGPGPRKGAAQTPRVRAAAIPTTSLSCPRLQL